MYTLEGTATALMAVAIGAEPGLTTGVEQLLFEGRFKGQFEMDGFDQPNYDVDPDGRFLMIEQSGVPSSVQIHVVLNWLSELETLVPLER